MSRLSDYLFALESALDRNDGDSEDAALGRRMAFRKTLTEWGDERWHEGYADGQRDVWESQRKAQRAAEEKSASAPEAGKE